MVTDEEFLDYQSMMQQQLDSIKVQMLNIVDTVEKQAELINQLIDGTPTSSITIISIKGDKADGKNSRVDKVVPRPGALSEIKPINKEDK